MVDFLYHYYDESAGPFRNLSDLDLEEAEQVLNDIRIKKKGFASKRSLDYLKIRRSLEWKARNLFIAKGGKPVRGHPHYMTFGECSWLLDWYPRGKDLLIPITEFDPYTISFTYGDLFPTMRYKDGNFYRGQVYTLEEIYQVIHICGLPQEWNPEGNKGPERYIEVQIWDDQPIRKIIGAIK
ncbi:hypothetical protein MUB24_14885 [Lederbergia sp. NSJ-179]|uniref:hypothetical protein n=1 Tax=Lederbergia sp. NSJ-179 TaxID=2931402 RepID=UPI001FD34400|nr:hypothetical protein [Lederbergia sp. NSJ-179]MCJ7842163.1 hypothetical protein [Lederbergia sp. NSJ-179]